ncbi:MAG: hypothetical protein QG601_1165 [Pseudomonadota bacterium]|nr:hypothetical protein [Pseudomonadota bacterium]
MNLRKLGLRVVMAVAAVCAAGSGAAAPVVGVTISNDGDLVDNSPWNLGYSFVANSAISVVSLGVWDQAGDGLVNRHEVGLWASNGTLLASTFVGAGTTGILDAGFRFADIAPVALTAGATYYVGATFNGPNDDQWTADPTSLVTAPQISYDSRRYQSGSTLVFPDLAGSNTTGYWGGNVRLDAVSVPEPASVLLLGLALAGLAATRRRGN